MRLGVIILLGACYLLNSPILQMVYPKVSEDYYQYVEFVATRAKVYECMFFLFFWLVYSLAERMVKSLAAGMMVLTAGSVVDKLFFGFTDYLYSDYILVAVAIIISIRVYVREVR